MIGAEERYLVTEFGRLRTQLYVIARQLEGHPTIIRQLDETMERARLLDHRLCKMLARLLNQRSARRQRTPGQRRRPQAVE